MISADLKQKIQGGAKGSKIVRENNKISLDLLADTTVTVADYERLTSGEDVFYAVTVEENPGQYFYSGKALTDILEEVTNAGEDLRGEQIYIGAKVRLKTGKTFTPVSLV